MNADDDTPLVRCACGNILAARVAGYLYVHHRGRKVLGLFASIGCECGLTWMNPDLAPHLPTVPPAAAAAA